MWSVQRAINEAVAPWAREPNKLLTAPTYKGRPVNPLEEERADRRRMVLERRQGFDRLHAEAGRRLRVLRAAGEVRAALGSDAGAGTPAHRGALTAARRDP